MIELNDLKKCQHFAVKAKYHSQRLSAAVEVTGEDATSFLQGQFSQNLRSPQSQSGIYGFWLTRKGKVAGDAVVVRHSDELCRIFSWSISGQALIDRLEQYIVADDVELTEEAERWQAWRAAGPGVNTWLGSWGNERAATEQYGWADARPLHPESVVIVAQNEPDWPVGWSMGASQEFEYARIAAGVPRVPIDLREDDFPQEGGMETVGVSFNKGCYLGQETMARIKSMGRIRRKLGRVAGTGSVPGKETTELFQAGRKAAELRSRVADGENGWLGLAMISRRVFRAGEPMALGANGEPMVSWLEAEERE